MTHLDIVKYCARSYDKEGYDKGEIWTINEVECFVVEFPDHVLLCFRGTEFTESIFGGKFTWSGVSNAWDILKDINFFPADTPTGKSHRGFSKAASQWFSRFAMRLGKIEKPLVIAGHSLGAGIAVQSVAIAKQTGFKVNEVVVFGEPAGFYFGSEANYAKLDVKTTSYLGDKDWIRNAMVPFLKVAASVPVTPRGTIHDINAYIKALSQ